jgi:hypothetical protein
MFACPPIDVTEVTAKCPHGGSASFQGLEVVSARSVYYHLHNHLGDRVRIAQKIMLLSAVWCTAAPTKRFGCAGGFDSYPVLLCNLSCSKSDDHTYGPPYRSTLRCSQLSNPWN